MSYNLYRIAVGLFFVLSNSLCWADSVAELYRSVIPPDKKLDAEWVDSLTERGHALDRGIAGSKKMDTLKYIGMPVGGICCGTVYMSGDGRLYVWDIFNQKKPGLVNQDIPIPEGYFGFKGEKKTVRPHDGASFLNPPTPDALKPPFSQGFGLKFSG